MEDIKKFLNEKQNPKAVEKALRKLSELLTRNETIEYIAVQKKPMLNMSPDCIALTNRRIIFCMPKSFGLSMNFEDLMWKDVADCHIKEGIMGATFTAVTVRRRRHYMEYLPKAQARLLYRYAQEREEEMTEYRRQRELENARAAAGGVVVQTNESKKESAEQKDDLLENLKKLKQLLENDLISKEEFDSKKSEILNRI